MNPMFVLARFEACGEFEAGADGGGLCDDVCGECGWLAEEHDAGAERGADVRPLPRRRQHVLQPRVERKAS
ncbi:MAG: hypothetical protein JWL83_1676 [Actinomycetia bacterium]|nr:hypothetical protein [Actinomycetes bacterium]